MNRKATQNLIFSLIFLIISLGILAIYVFKSQDLVAKGIDQNVFYISLIPLGFSAAAFLFGTLRSYAHYTGKHLNGTLELGGPVIIFILTIIGGFQLVQKVVTFDYLFLVTTKSFKAFNESSCTFKLITGTEIKEAKVKNSEARFYGIPSSYKSQLMDLYPYRLHGCS